MFYSQKTLYSFFISLPPFWCHKYFLQQKYLLNIISLVLCHEYFYSKKYLFDIFPPCFFALDFRRCTA